MLPVRPRAAIARLAGALDASARLQWFAVFVPVLAAYLVSLRSDPWTMSADPTGVTPSAWGVAHHGSPVVPKTDWPFINPWKLAVDSENVVSNRTPGLVYLAAPFYRLLPRAGTWDVLPASLAAALVTAAAVATFGLLIRRLAGPRTGLAAAFVAGLATTTWSVSGTQLFPHGPDQLLLVLAMTSIAAGGAVGTGAAFGLAVLIRPPLALAAAVLGLAQTWRTRRIRPTLVIGALTATGLAGFLWYSHHYWNVVVAAHDAGSTISRGALNPTSTHNYERMVTDWSPDAIGEYLYKICGALVSPGRGVLVGAPFLLVLLPGLRPAWRAAPSWVRAAAIGGVLYLLVQLKAEIFTGGKYFWSYRYPLEALTLCGPLLVLCWQHWTSRVPRRRAAFAALVTVAVSMQAVGALCFRGPFPDLPWGFHNLVAALTGERDALAWALLLTGWFGGAWLYLRGRSRSARADVLDVAGTDHPLTTLVDRQAQPAVAVDVQREAPQHGAVDGAHEHRPAERRAGGPVRRCEPGRVRIAPGLQPALQPHVQAVEDRGEDLDPVQAARTAQRE